MVTATLLAAVAMGMGAAEPLRVLVFSKTAGFRHDSIGPGIEAFRKMAEEKRFEAEFTEDSSQFNASNLKRFKVVVFLNTTGDVFDEAQQDAFQAWYRAGGGFVGIHAATDTEYGWPWYGELVGAYFRSHPPGVHAATITVEDPKHPAMAHLPRTFRHTDEWYDFRDNPRGRVTVLATVNNKDYPGSVMGDDHPIVWCREFDGSRSFYTAFGHTHETFTNPGILEMLWRGMNWTVRRDVLQAGR